MTFDGPEPLSLQPGDGVLIPVKREGGGLQNGFLCEDVLPVEGQVEAIPGVWDTGAVEGSILVAALDADLTLEAGDVVAEVRAGCVDSTVCGCGSVETPFASVASAPVCESCGVGRPEDSPPACYACESSERIAAMFFQGCGACSKGFGMMKQGAKVRVLCFVTAAFFASQCFSAMSGVGNLLIEDPDMIGFLGNVSKGKYWWEARGGYGGVWDDLRSLEGLGSPDVETYPFETLLTQSLREAWHLYSTKNLRKWPSAGIPGAVPQGS